MLLRTNLPCIILLLLCEQASAQWLDDGSHVYENDSIRLEVTLSSEGWTIDKATVIDKLLGSHQISDGGEYRKMGFGDDTGWYELASAECFYSFEVNRAERSIRLSRYECKNGSPAYEGTLRVAEIQADHIPVIQAQQLREGRIMDWGPKPSEQSTDGSAESWVYESMMCAGPSEARASSSLASQSKASYHPPNVMDEDPTTAWVEGKEDHGVGEYLEVHMEPYSNGIYLLNGYQASSTAWENNGRVKRMQVSINGTIVCLVDLSDRMGAQRFDLPPNALDLFATQGGDVILRLTILEVYPGLKWKDTAISEVWTCGG